MRWALVVLVLIGCGKQPAQSGNTGSGSAPPPPAPTEASPTGAAIDAAVAAAPEEPLLIATADKDKLVVVELGAAGMKPRWSVAGGDSIQFAWLDARTLVRMAPWTKDEKSVVEKIVDGKLTENAVLTDPWTSADLFVVGDKEAWLRRCLVEPEGADSCTKFGYRRVLPAPAKDATKPPANADFQRVAGRHGPSAVQRVIPSVTAPGDVKLVKAKLTRQDDDLDVIGYRCTSKTGKSEHPIDMSYYEALSYEVRSFRWVFENPPIYEVHATWLSPISRSEDDNAYYIACQQKVVAGFIGLGETLWGEHVLTEDKLDGEWIFRDGDKVLGKLHGNEVRANR